MLYKIEEENNPKQKLKSIVKPSGLNSGGLLGGYGALSKPYNYTPFTSISPSKKSSQKLLKKYVNFENGKIGTKGRRK